MITPLKTAKATKVVKLNPYVEHFDLDGKKFRLFKRKPSPDLPWWIDTVINGNRIFQSSQTNDAAAAKRVFTPLIAAAKASTWVAAAMKAAGVPQNLPQVAEPAPAPTFATVQQVIDCYNKNHREGIAEKTRHGNIKALERVIRLVKGDETKMDQVSTEILTAAFKRKWKNKIIDLAEKETEVRAMQIKRSANSTFRLAKSLFARPCLPLYKDADLTLPDTIREFCDEPDFRKVQKADYMPPSDELLKKTLDHLPDFKEADPNLWLAVHLALAGGLRLSELAVAKWTWFVERDGKKCISCNDEIFKGNKQGLEIPLLEPWATELLTKRPEKEEDRNTTVLRGSITERGFEVARRVSAWLHKEGWQTEKALHEFRAYAGSQVAIKNGIYHASMFLRHSSVTVTEKCYMRYVRMRQVSS